MSRKRIFAGALGLAAMTMVAEPSAFALPPTPLTASSSQPTPAARQTAHASLRLDISRAKAWVGQGIPVTLQAFFRGAEGVTLEGTPQLTSSGIFTSELSREPRQSTEIIGGEPVLVATWTGTLTPSSAATLLIVAELPVQMRYREAAPSRVEQADPFGDDPFGALTSNPFDTSAIQRFFQQSMQQSMGSLGRIRQEAVSLRTSARPIEVQDLPTANRPSSFTGAMGRFNLRAAVSSTHVHASEPVTLQVVVDGDGDLDRVDLGGVSTSNTWKAYPPKATIEASSKGKRGRKVFEQVLVPLRGGDSEPAGGRHDVVRSRFRSLRDECNPAARRHGRWHRGRCRRNRPDRPCSRLASAFGDGTAGRCGAARRPSHGHTGAHSPLALSLGASPCGPGIRRPHPPERGGAGASPDDAEGCFPRGSRSVLPVGARAHRYPSLGALGCPSRGRWRPLHSRAPRRCRQSARGGTRHGRSPPLRARVH